MILNVRIRRGGNLPEFHTPFEIIPFPRFPFRGKKSPCPVTPSVFRGPVKFWIPLVNFLRPGEFWLLDQILIGPWNWATEWIFGRPMNFWHPQDILATQWTLGCPKTAKIFIQRGKKPVSYSPWHTLPRNGKRKKKTSPWQNPKTPVAYPPRIFASSENHLFEKTKISFPQANIEFLFFNFFFGSGTYDFHFSNFRK